MNAAQNPQAQPKATAIEPIQKGSAEYWRLRYMAKLDDVKALMDDKDDLKTRIKELEARPEPEGTVAEMFEKLTFSREYNRKLRKANTLKADAIAELQNELRETRLQCAILSSNGALQRTRGYSAPMVTETTIAANPDTVSSEPNTPYSEMLEKKPSKMVTRPEVGSEAWKRGERKFSTI